MTRTTNVAACLAAMGEAPPTAQLTVLRARRVITENALDAALTTITKLSHLSEGHAAVLSLRAAAASLQAEVSALEGAIAELGAR